MTDKEKAWAYDGALNRAKAAIDNAADKDLVKGIVTAIFPLLRESEDERIRKELINFILYKAKGVSEEQEHSWVVYLYKQKINTEGDFARGYDCGYEACLNSHGAEWFEKQKEIPMPNSTELIEMWDKEKKMLKEKDFRDDAWRIAYNAFMDGFAKGTCVKFEKQKERGPLTKEEEYILHRIIEHLEDETCPSEWISLLHDIYCLPYEKQKEKKPTNSEKPKEWNEEDVAMIKRVIERIEAEIQYGDALTMAYGNQEIAWLKSLRPSWKPSEEQMLKEAAEGRISSCGLHNAIFFKDQKWTDMLDKYEEGDKVRVIVLPKEDQTNG